MIDQKFIQRHAHTVLKVFALSMLSIVAAVIVSMLFYGIADLRSPGGGYIAQNGVADLSGGGDSTELGVITGEWEYFPGARYTPAQLSSLTPQLIRMPGLTASMSHESATFRLILQTGERTEPTDLALYINSRGAEMALYFNGALIKESRQGDAPDTMLSKLTDDLLLDASGEQEIVISVSDAGAFLYQNQLRIGSHRALARNIEIGYIVKYFMIGMLTVFLIVGLSFMAMHPRHVFISTLAVFDFFIIVRALLSIPELYEVMFVVAGRTFLTTEALARALIVLYFGACLFDCRMASMFFSQEGKRREVWIRRLVLCVLAAASVLLPSALLPLRLAIVGFAAWTLISRIVGSAIRLKKGRSFSEVFSAGRILFTAGVLSYDSLVLTGFSDQNETMVYLYGLIAVMHLIVRLWDNYKTYIQAYELNLNLEDMVSERTAQLTEVNEKLAKLSIHDPLTGAYNRLHFENRMDVLLKRSDALTHICICILDIDFFKRINDTYGHDMGDTVLKRFVHIIHANLTDTMTLYRIGGEEFVVFSHSLPSEEYVAHLEHIRMTIQNTRFPHGDTVTTSIGVSAYRQGYTLKDMLKEADACLYEAKNTGRNRLVHHVDFEMADV